MVISFLVFSCRFGLLLAATELVPTYRHRKKKQRSKAGPRTLGPPNTKRPGQLKRVFKFEEEEVARGSGTTQFGEFRRIQQFQPVVM